MRVTVKFLTPPHPKYQLHAKHCFIFFFLCKILTWINFSVWSQNYREFKIIRSVITANQTYWFFSVLNEWVLIFLLLFFHVSCESESCVSNYFPLVVDVHLFVCYDKWLQHERLKGWSLIKIFYSAFWWLFYWLSSFCTSF